MRTKCAKVLARAAIVPEINEHYAATPNWRERLVFRVHGERLGGR